MIENISAEEKNDAVRRLERILNEYNNALKTAEKVYEDAAKKGDLELQKQIQKKIESIKKEETSIKNILTGIKAIC
jgi:hypothetical protein